MRWSGTLKATVLQDVVISIYFNHHLAAGLAVAPDWQRMLNLAERAWSMLPKAWTTDSAAGRAALRCVQAARRVVCADGQPCGCLEALLHC